MDERMDMRAAESAGADHRATSHPSYRSSVTHHRHAAAVETTAPTAVSAASALREGRRRAAEQQGCTAYRHQHS
jgi:hypothetical protein